MQCHNLVLKSEAFQGEKGLDFWWQCHQHQLNYGSFVTLTNPTKTNNILISGGSIELQNCESLFVGACVFKNNPHEDTQLCHIHHISRLFKCERKAPTRVYKFPQLLLHNLSLALPSRSIVGELHTFMAFTVCVLLLQFSKNVICCFAKCLPHNTVILCSART